MDGYRLVVEVPARFSDGDPLGHVNNAAYLSYLEEARIAYLREVLGLTRAGELGVILARVEIDYRSPAYHHEVLRVGCRATRLGGASVHMDYRVEEKRGGRLVAEARSVLVAYDYALARPARLSESLRSKMEEFDGIP